MSQITDEQPYKSGDKVILAGVGECVVQQCFNAVGGWRIIANGPKHAANPKGFYDFPAALSTPPVGAEPVAITRDDLAEIISKAGAPPGPPDGPIGSLPDGHFLKVQAYKQADAVLAGIARLAPLRSDKANGDVKASVQKAYDAINAGGPPYSARECKASYAISTALAAFDAVPNTVGEDK